MTALTFSNPKTRTVPVYLVEKDTLHEIDGISEFALAWAKANNFTGKSKKILTVPDSNGKLDCVLFGIGNNQNPMITGVLSAQLPKGNYRLAGKIADAEHATLGWLLGAYAFRDYKNKPGREAKLLPPKGINQTHIRRIAESVFLARDLINMPANDMGPAELEETVRKLGRTYKAKVSVIKGDALLQKNFPMIHTVGRASADAPRLIDLKWGKTNHPKVTLVGKGVTFDTGGLNIKPGNSMSLMKKDMGGAANTIALARMIMDANLPVRLRLLVPAVENAISGNAFRPGDILPSRKGICVEIGNTDAEGRLILADALCLGDEETPDLMIDMATLTGAARVALGPDLPPFYTHDDAFADEISQSSYNVLDPLWRMPLWAPYQEMLSSKVADVNHISAGGFAGSVTAALFLSRFVEETTSWAHFDIYGWVPSAKPWAPIGGEAQGIRALFDVISKRYAD